jgi:hypothetical protein
VRLRHLGGGGDSNESRWSRTGGEHVTTHTDDAGWLTLTEIARRLGEPLQKVSYWRDTHGAYIEERRRQTGPSRVSRLYRLATFELLAVLMRNKTPRSDVHRRLAAEAGNEAKPAEDVQAAMLEELRGIKAAVERIADELTSPGRIEARTEGRTLTDPES